MKITIVGAGAMGGLWASRLAATGHDVAVLDVAQPVVEAIERDGLIVEGKDGSTSVTRLRAASDPVQIGPSDVVFFFTKAHHTAAAADLARPLVTPATTVVSQQNGWGNSDTLAGVYPADQIAMGVTYHSATVRAPGRVAHTGINKTFIGPYVDGAPLDRAQTIGAVLSEAGIETTATADVKTEVWKKLILNAGTLPIAGLTRLTIASMGEPGPVLDLIDALAAEATAVANGLGRDISLEERLEAIHQLLPRGGAGKASMLQDVEAQRKTEIEVVNGAVVREGERLGIDVRLNKAMVALVGGLERSWRQ
jgi:2-dehydropantoate 2-reductase